MQLSIQIVVMQINYQLAKLSNGEVYERNRDQLFEITERLSLIFKNKYNIFVLNVLSTNCLLVLT